MQAWHDTAWIRAAKRLAFSARARNGAPNVRVITVEELEECRAFVRGWSSCTGRTGMTRHEPVEARWICAVWRSAVRTARQRALRTPGNPLEFCHAEAFAWQTLVKARKLRTRWWRS
jgi:hypothetical protein